MPLTRFIRDIIPEAIPTLGAIIYNAIPAKLLRVNDKKLFFHYFCNSFYNSGSKIEGHHNTERPFKK